MGGREAGTAGMVPWQLKARGKLFHSGLPHKGVNALELVNATGGRQLYAGTHSFLFSRGSRAASTCAAVAG